MGYIPYSEYSQTDLSSVTPEMLWGFLIASSFLLALVVGFVVVAMRGEAEPRPARSRSFKIPPIPMASDFDPRITAKQRALELSWLQSLMEAPAHGENSEAEGQPEEPTGN